MVIYVRYFGLFFAEQITGLFQCRKTHVFNMNNWKRKRLYTKSISCETYFTSSPCRKVIYDFWSEMDVSRRLLSLNVNKKMNPFQSDLQLLMCCCIFTFSHACLFRFVLFAGILSIFWIEISIIDMYERISLFHV